MPSVGFEPTRTKALVPKTSMSTSSITKAFLKKEQKKKTIKQKTNKKEEKLNFSAFQQAFKKS